MFTPQRSTWSPKPRVSSETPKSKGKGIARNRDSAVAPPAPPLDSLNGGELDRDGVDMDAWKRFKVEGLLDESLFHKKGPEVLASRILELEKVLHDYQYTMGLLLIEKKEWSSKMEELRARLAESEYNLKPEKAAHMIALTESERREDNLCMALGIKMQHISDLERTLGEMGSENAELKLAYGKKMEEVHALEACIREKKLEIERTLHSANAILAEANRKSSEINKKLEAVEERESKLQRETTIGYERKALEKDIFHKEKLQMQKLLEVEEKLNHREREVNHKQELINKREKILESKMNKIEIKEKDLETVPEALKKWEESLKLEEKKLVVEKDQIMKDMHKIKASINELQSLRDALKAEEHQIAKDREKFEISKEEREQYIQKQSELKQQIEMYVNMKEELSKEIESQREEREKLEKEWESLNEEKLMLQGERKKIHDEKERLEKWHHKEQEKLRNRETNANAEIERQLDDIKLQKEAFENTMKRKKTMAQEEVTKQLADVTRELELQKHELEMTMQKKQENTETKLKEEEKEFENSYQGESQSQSVSIGGGPHKKHKTSTTSGVQTPTGEKRYNLRRSTIAKNSEATT